MRRSSWTSFVISTLLLAGCAVGPNYKRPQVAVPSQWTVAAARGTAATPIEKDAWWSSFKTPELNSLAGRSAKQTWTSSWLSNVYRKLEQHEASLVRVIFLPSTERPRPPAIAKESSCQPGRRNLPSSSQSNTTIFRAALPPHGNWMSSEEFVGACRLPLPT